METRKKKVYSLLLLLVVAVGLLHSFTPTERLLLHDLYRRFSYFPIVVAAILYGVRGGLFLATCTSIAFIPHLYHFFPLGPKVYLAELPEILLYFGAGGVIGAIAGREKQVRKKYQALSKRLERSYKKLHRQAGQLVEAEEQLHASQKLSALGQLAASLAHEIKNPLAAIKGAVEILTDDFPKDHPKHEFSEILFKETRRLSSTVDEVLHYSKRSQTHAFAPRRESLAAIIKGARGLLEHTFKGKGINFDVRLDEETAGSMLVADKMTQVMLNLFLNGCEAMEENGVLTVTSGIHEDSIEIRVCDSGPGIAEAIQGEIFTPFYSTKEEGTGLGLAISSRIVASYGGILAVAAPQSGSGGCFVITLPRVSEERL